MNIFGAVALLVISGAGAWAGGAGQTSIREVTVCLSPGNNAAILYRAQAAATQIFKQAGVRLVWRDRERFCLSEQNSIVVTLSLATPRGQHPGALAYALPFEGTHIVLFYDRVLTAVKPAVAPYLMGHVLAHEIAHILQGISRHSASGIMKPYWDSRDYVQMDGGHLNFAEEDILLIRNGLDSSSQPVTAARRSGV
jgi:hypothetical protein